MRYSILIIVLLFSLSAYSQDGEWKLAKEEKGITVFTRKIEGSKIKEYRAEMEIEASVDEIYGLLTDVPNIDTWYHNARNSVWVEKISDTEGIYYTEFNSPWPARDRDNVAHFKIEKDEAAGGFTIQFRTAPGKVPIKKKFVRIEQLKASWIVKPLKNNRVSIIHQGHVEPKKVPAWIANSFVVDTPFKTFRSLQELLKK